MAKSGIMRAQKKSVIPSVVVLPLPMYLPIFHSGPAVLLAGVNDLATCILCCRQRESKQNERDRLLMTSFLGALVMAWTVAVHAQLQLNIAQQTASLLTHMPHFERCIICCVGTESLRWWVALVTNDTFSNYPSRNGITILEPHIFQGLKLHNADVSVTSSSTLLTSSIIVCLWRSHPSRNKGNQILEGN
jgi:hypothetical protein